VGIKNLLKRTQQEQKGIDVLIIEDHLMFAEAWKNILEADAEFNKVIISASAEEALITLEHFNPHIILLDISLKKMSGIEAIPAIVKISPVSRIIGLSIHALPALVKQMMSLGAYGYLTKTSSLNEFFEAIEQVMSGNKYICVEIRDVLAEHLFQSDDFKLKDIDKLTKRERELISYMKQNYSLKDAAQKMEITISTAESHQYNILKKLNLASTRDLLNFVERNRPLL
jgi:DNA-binding NarL/FixJ family response regulator